MSRVVVATVPDLAAAQILVEILGEAELEATSEPRAGDAYLGSAQGVAFAVLVDADDEEAARSVLARPGIDDENEAERTDERDPTAAAADARDPAVVLSSWDRRRQSFALFLLFFMPLPLSSYYARATRLGHALLLSFLAALTAARLLARPELYYLALAAKALDAWMGPVLLAQRQRRHRPWLRWALVLPLFWGLGFALHRKASYDGDNRRALAMLEEVGESFKAGTLDKVPAFPNVPAGRVMQLFLEGTMAIKVVQQTMNASPPPSLALPQPPSILEYRAAAARLVRYDRQLADIEQRFDELRRKLVATADDDPQGIATMEELTKPLDRAQREYSAARDEVAKTKKMVDAWLAAFDPR